MLPARPNPDWYRKAAKQKLVELRAANPDTTLSLAQLEVAREAGCSSWRALIAAINTRLGAPPAPAADGLFAAIRARDHELLRGLLEQGADPEQRHGDAGHTALSWAVTFGYFDLALTLVEGGAQTDLYCAAAMGDLPTVRSFFGPDGSLAANAGHTCERRSFASVTPRAYRPAGGDLVSTAMYAAVRHVRVEVARFLADRGVDVQARAFNGATLLHWAYCVGSKPLVDLLIARGADPAAEDETFNCTPRAFAICQPARLGSEAEVAARLAEDPSLATINEGRGTPLHEAARADNEAIARLLLAHGADPGARDRDGLTPRDLARGEWAEVLL